MSEKKAVIMEKIKNMNKSYYFLVLIVLIFVVILCVNSCSNKKENPKTTNKVKITLTGDSVVEVAKNGTYSELGVVVKDSKGNDLSDEVIINDNNLDTSVPGEYTITYSIKVDDKTEKITRKVVVLPTTIEDDFYLSLEGKSLITLEVGNTYVEPGFIAYDKTDKDITSKVEVTNGVNTNKAGLYQISYVIKNSKGISITKYRLVKVIEYKTTLIVGGGNPHYVVKGTSFSDPGYYAFDTKDGNITNKVTKSGSVNTNTLGNYVIRYSVTNSRGKVENATREVIVIENTNTIGNLTFSLKGSESITLNYGDKYVEPGYTATDSKDGNITSKVKVTGSVNTNESGMYVLNYSVTNSTGITKSLIRIITVKDSEVSIPEDPDDMPIETLRIDAVPSTTGYVKDAVIVTVTGYGSNFSYLLLPDGTKINNKTTTFRAIENNTYTFNAVDKSGNQVSKTLTIKNIDKTVPIGSCVLDAYGTVTVIARDNDSGIKGMIYSNGKITSELMNETKYAFGSYIKTATVKIQDKAGNEKTISCNFDDKLEVHMLKVGRDEAIIIRSLDKTILIDGGSSTYGTTVKNYLNKLGVDTIDAMIGTHLHYNHIQAQATIANNFIVKKAYYDSNINNCKSKNVCVLDGYKGIKVTINALKNKNIPTEVLDVGETILIDSIQIKNYAPITKATYSNAGYPENVNSMNFIVTFGNTKFFFTGDHFSCTDIKKKFGAAEFKDIDVFNTPHHGEEGLSGCSSLIKTMNPYIVLTSNTRTQYPTSGNKSYFKNSKVKFYSTGTHGNVVVTSDGENLKVATKVNPSDYNRNVD